MHKQNVLDKDKQGILGISRATYYRRKKQIQTGIIKSKRPKNLRKSRFNKDIWNLIRKIRTEHKTYGKAKIFVILRRDYGIEISESSVGRILNKLSVLRSLSSPRYRRHRMFTSYAKRREFKLYSQMKIGENVQIDHMVRTLNGHTYRIFVACDKKSKWAYAEPFIKANSKNAAKFLKNFIKNAAFPIKSIQVDGGSEFMKDFEATCEELNIPLFVLPPASPKIKGNVKRMNRIITEEFLHETIEDSLVVLRIELNRFIDNYNSFRTHSSLQGSFVVY